MRILLVEDEQRLQTIVKNGLTEEGFAVDTASTGEEGKFLGESEPYDLIILDRMLPDMDGVDICRHLRQKKIAIPVLLLTAKSSIDDRVAGLNAGADDYLTKPFAFSELKARIFALIRRSKGESSPILSVDDLTLDPSSHIVRRDAKEISMTPKEFAILELLLRNKGQVVSRTMIMEHVWDYNFDSLSNVVDVFVVSLRKKIDSKSDRKIIQTIHGVGYKIAG